jgi:plasmid stability protein
MDGRMSQEDVVIVRNDEVEEAMKMRRAFHTRTEERKARDFTSK